MKKTIIASAIAAVVAAPAAMAEVSVSGQINQEFYSTDGGDLTSDANADLTFSGSEDLGNGMKVSFKITTVHDAEDGATTSVDQGSNHSISLSGDFGTISMGDTEMFIESKVAAMAANDASDTATNEVTATMGTHEQGTIEYTSPSFNGVKVVLSGSTNGATNAAAGDDFDTTSIGVEYSNGPLLVRAATADDGVNDEDVIGIQYTMGDIKLGYVNADSGSTSSSWMGASYTMGANTFAVSSRSSDSSGDDDNIFSVKHAMSKQTYVGLTYVDDETSTSDTTYVTVGHKF